jgi:hypothetical protein
MQFLTNELARVKPGSLLLHASAHTFHLPGEPPYPFQTLTARQLEPAPHPLGSRVSAVLYCGTLVQFLSQVAAPP